MYKCCMPDDSDGLCNSDDPEVICSDQYPGLLRYQACYRDSLPCGNEIIFIVNATMATTTTEFFANPSVCWYRLRTYEENDEVTLNITFTSVVKAEAYMVYQKSGKSSYVEEQIELNEGENRTFLMKRGDLGDKDIYIIAKALPGAFPGTADVTFETTQIPIP